MTGQRQGQAGHPGTCPGESSCRPDDPSRRQILHGCALALGTGSLAACGGDSSPTSGTSADGGISVPLADTEVGSSTYYDDAEIIVSRPTEGEVVVFDATCPHQGCMVSTTDGDGALVCPCHGSTFAFDTGEVVAGPATTGLSTRSAQIDGEDVLISG